MHLACQHVRFGATDRSNASVDIFSGATNTFLGRASGFVGQQSTTSISGPDGVVVVNNGGTVTLYAGDGNSTLRSFNVSSFAGQTVTLSFSGTEDTSLQTSFVVDDTALNVS